MSDRSTQPGRRLVDLVNELERRLTGAAPGPGLAPELSAHIPDAATYVLLLADGLGHHQLGHPAAAMLRRSNRGSLTAPFPTTTTVSLTTVASGTSPRSHGVIGHLMWFPELERVVNTLKWISPWGEPIDFPVERVVPGPNLWERLDAAGIEPITVQPAGFEGTKLSTALYRGCRFEGASTVDELVEATVTLARVPGRLVFSYLPHVDVAAHVSGQRSSEYVAALSMVDTAWSQIATRLDPGAVAVGTADHGHLDYTVDAKIMLDDPQLSSLTFFGDSRSLYVNGDRALIEDLARRHRADLVWDIGPSLGDGHPHPELDGRVPTALLRAPRGKVLLPGGFDRRLTGYHGGTEPEEVDIPMLVSR